jgi:hypothetical protein
MEVGRNKALSMQEAGKMERMGVAWPTFSAAASHCILAPAPKKRPERLVEYRARLKRMQVQDLHVLINQDSRHFEVSRKNTSF